VTVPRTTGADAGNEIVSQVDDLSWRRGRVLGASGGDLERGGVGRALGPFAILFKFLPLSTWPRETRGQDSA